MKPRRNSLTYTGIERINVHAPDKSSGHRSQQVDIIYNFIGILPNPQTKKEVA